MFLCVFVYLYVCLYVCVSVYLCVGPYICVHAFVCMCNTACVSEVEVVMCLYWTESEAWKLTFFLWRPEMTVAS